MEITHRIKMDLAKPGITPRIPIVQGDTYTRKLQKKLYSYLRQRRSNNIPLSLREKEFISLYEEAMKHQSKTGTRVKRENKSPKRKKATTDNVSDG